MKISDYGISFHCILQDSEHDGLYLYHNVDINSKEMFFAALNHEEFLNDFNKETGMDIKISDDINKLKNVYAIFDIDNESEPTGAILSFTIRGNDIKSIQVKININEYNLFFNGIFRISADGHKVTMEDIKEFNIDFLKTIKKGNNSDEYYLNLCTRGVFSI